MHSVLSFFVSFLQPCMHKLHCWLKGGTFAVACLHKWLTKWSRFCIQRLSGVTMHVHLLNLFFLWTETSLPHSQVLYFILKLMIRDPDLFSQSIGVVCCCTQSCSCVRRGWQGCLLADVPRGENAQNGILKCVLVQGLAASLSFLLAFFIATLSVIFLFEIKTLRFIVFLLNMFLEGKSYLKSEQ